jgi:hypothetical protein
MELLVLQSAINVMGLESYSLVVQGITLLVSIKLSIAMCATEHSLGLAAYGVTVAATHMIRHSNVVLVDWLLQRQLI